MEYNQYISPDGQTYNFDNQVDKFLVNISGTGMPEINPITNQLPFRHGEIRVGYRLAPRLIRLMHHSISGCDRPSMYSNRDTLLDILRPNRTSTEEPGVLRKIFEDGSKRDLNVYFSGSLTLDETEDHLDRARWYVRDIIEFTAYDPIFYDPTESSQVLNISSIEEVVFPITFDISFSGNIVEAIANINYSGNWETSPIIEITGPVNNPNIVNETTGKRIVMNYKVKSGETVTINTDSYKPTVVDGSSNNLIGYISGQSNLIDFDIVPAPVAASGVNAIKVWGGANYEPAQFTIKYMNRYVGY